MTAITLLAVAVQLSTVVLVYRALGRARTQSLGFLFLCVMVVYHGLTELLQSVFPGRNSYRALVEQQELHSWLLWVTGAIAIYALTYYSVVRRKKSFVTQTRRLELPASLNWRIWLPIGILSQLIIINGKDVWQESYWISGVLSTLGMMPMQIGTLSLMLEKSRNWQLPCLIGYALFATLLASRFAVIGSMVAFVFMMSRFGKPLTNRMLVALFAIGVFLAVAVSSARSVYGREELKQSLTKTAVALVRGAQTMAIGTVVVDEVLNDIVYRFDANSIASVLMTSRRMGTPPAGYQPLVNNVYLCVPTFLNPQKLESDVVARDERAYMNAHYGLPEDVDFIYGLLATLYGYYGIISLLGGCILLGAMYGWLDRYITPNRSVIGSLMFMCFANTAILYEQNVSIYMLSMRSVLAMIVVCLVIQMIFGALGGRSSPSPREEGMETIKAGKGIL